MTQQSSCLWVGGSRAHEALGCIELVDKAGVLQRPLRWSNRQCYTALHGMPAMR